MKKKTKKGKNTGKKRSGNRKFKVTFMLNLDEQKVLDFYLKKYRIENKSSFFRSILLSSILKQLNEDTPTLFNAREMKGF